MKAFSGSPSFEKSVSAYDSFDVVCVCLVWFVFV